MASTMLPLLAIAMALAPATAFPTRTSSALEKRASVLAASDHCGDTDYVILPSTPWIVYNMFYNAAEAVGTQCTNYDTVTTASDGTQEVVWSSVTDIEYVESTNNVPKGYSFVGLTENLETQLSGIQSIPATYTWTRTNTTAFKGNICFDFMTSDTKGDSTSTAAEEHMLWLQYEGGQLPIGWADGAVATVASLYGTSWKLYSGVNTDTGITVRSLLPDTQFDGTFTGDIKDWLDELATLGAFSTSTYVNVGNAGTEMFYGDSIMNATLGLQINLGTDTTSASNTVSTSSAPVVASSATSTIAKSSAAPVKSSSSSAVVVASSSSKATPVAPIATATASPVESTSTAEPMTSAVATSVSSVEPTSTIEATSTSAATPEPTGSDGEGGDDSCDAE